MTYYRYQDRKYSYGDEQFGYYTRVHVDLQEYEVIKETRKGVKIATYIGDNKGRQILHDSRKKFACPTVEEAKQSFIARKKRQIKILSKQLKDAKIALEYLEYGPKI